MSRLSRSIFGVTGITILGLLASAPQAQAATFYTDQATWEADLAANGLFIQYTEEFNTPVPEDSSIVIPGFGI